MFSYYMVRWTSTFYYTLEFLIAIIVFFITLSLYLKGIDKKVVFVFIIAGVFNTCVELFIQIIGARSIEGAYLFNIPIEFPLICLILGFYEGGVKFLVPYYFTKFIVNKDEYSKKMLILILIIVILSFLSYSLITRLLIDSGTTIITLTQRSLYSLPVIFALSLSFILTFLYFVLNVKIPKKDIKIIFYFYIGLILYLLCFTIPLHVFLIRYIGIGESFAITSLGEQIFWMYVYFLLFEGPGALMMLTAIIYHLNLIELSKGKLL